MMMMIYSLAGAFSVILFRRTAVLSRYYSQYALDVHSRVETDSMMKMLQQLTGLRRTHETLSNVIDVYLMNPTTSTVGDIYNAVDRIVQQSTAN